MILFLLVVLSLPPVAVQSLTVQSGTLLVDGQQVQVGPGTFVPAPRDEKLAVTIEEKNAQIRELEAKLRACETKVGIAIQYRVERERTINKFWVGKYADLELENMVLKSWWNRYGKTVLWAVISAGAAAIVTWEISRYTD